MSQKLSQSVTYWLGVVAIGLVVGLSLQFVRAWTEPAVAPPGGNVGAPINTGGIQQTKAGNLIVSNLGALNVTAVNDILAFGSVGIGTKSPGTNKLQVNGKIQAVGGDICTDQGGGKCLSTAGGGESLNFLEPGESVGAQTGWAKTIINGRKYAIPLYYLGTTERVDTRTKTKYGNYLSTYDDFRHGPDDTCQKFGYKKSTGNYACRDKNCSTGVWGSCTPAVDCRHNGEWYTSTNPFGCLGQNWCEGRKYIEWIDCIK